MALRLVANMDENRDGQPGGGVADDDGLVAHVERAAAGESEDVGAV